MLETNKIIQGDCLEVLKTLPDESINCVMTSPPYWALRDYGTAKWEGGNLECEHKTGFESKKSTLGGGKDTQNEAGSFYKEICGKCGAKRIDNQLGLEPTFQEYINKLCDTFDEIKRVLRKDGTCWVNLGDTYYGSGKGAGGDITNSKQVWTFEKKDIRICQNCGKEFEGRKFQNFCGSACSGVDNTTRLKKGLLQNKSLTLIPFRFAIGMQNRGWILRNTIIWYKPNCMPSSVKDRFTCDFEYIFFFVKNKKYWFETQYEETAESTKKDSRFNNKSYNPKEIKAYDTNFQQSPASIRRNVFSNPLIMERRNKRAVWKITTKPFKEAHFATYPEELCETPIKAGCPESGIVLDPFFGAGTTGVVALKQNKKFIGIELNPEYIKIAEARIKPYLEQTRFGDEQK